MFCPALALGQGGGPTDILPVVLQYPNDVAQYDQTVEIQFALGRRLNDLLGFRKATGEEIAPREIAVPIAKSGSSAISLREASIALSYRPVP